MKHQHQITTMILILSLLVIHLDFIFRECNQNVLQKCNMGIENELQPLSPEHPGGTFVES